MKIIICSGFVKYCIASVNSKRYLLLSLLLKWFHNGRQYGIVVKGSPAYQKGTDTNP